MINIVKESKTCFTSWIAIDITCNMQRTTSGKVARVTAQFSTSSPSQRPLIILTGSPGPGSGQGVIWCCNVGQPLVFPRSWESCV